MRAYHLIIYPLALGWLPKDMELNMSQDLMNYDRMTQMALRGVIRDAIRRVIREGKLPGAHHFYISFLTRYPGVDIDEGLLAKYPEEITIVLEHQFWDLKAHDESFEVTLKFGGVPKYLSVPYVAITRFHDPSVGFAMQFDPPEEMQDKQDSPPTLARLKLETTKTKQQAKQKPRVSLAKKTTATRPKKNKLKKNQQDKAEPQKDAPADAKPNSKNDEANKIVSLDAFRKK